MSVAAASATGLRESAYAALGDVLDPELDEPVTDLGFVRSVEVYGGPARADVVVHLRLPTSFCSPNFAYLMASDAKDVLTALAWTGRVVVELDDHHDSGIINRGSPRTPATRGRSCTRPSTTSRSCGRPSAARRTRRPWSVASPGCCAPSRTVRSSPSDRSCSGTCRRRRIPRLSCAGAPPLGCRPRRTPWSSSTPTGRATR